MTEISFSNVVIVAAVAFAAPLALGLIRKLRLPAVVLEIVLGLAVGPSGLGWVKFDLPVQVLALVGLAFLLFLAGCGTQPMGAVSRSCGTPTTRPRSKTGATHTHKASPPPASSTPAHTGTNALPKRHHEISTKAALAPTESWACDLS